MDLETFGLFAGRCAAAQRRQVVPALRRQISPLIVCVLILSSPCLIRAAQAAEKTPRELLIAVKEAIWLEDYAAGRGALELLHGALTPKEKSFYAPYLRPFEFAASAKPEVLAEGLRVLRQRVVRPQLPGHVDPAARIYLAMLLIRMEREDEALSVLESIPKHSDPRFWMYEIQKAHLVSKLYADRREWQQAVGALNLALPLVPEVDALTAHFENPPAICRVFRVRVEQIYDAYLREVDPARWLYKQYALAARSSDRKQFAAVKRHYQELLKDHPRSYWSGRATFEQGLRTWEQGQEAAAADLWQRMIATDPRGSWRGHALLALADYRLGVQLDFAAALSLYEQAWKSLADDRVDQTWHAIAPQIAGRLVAMLSVTGRLDPTEFRNVRPQPLEDPLPQGELSLRAELIAVLETQSEWLEPTSTLIASRAEGFAPRLSSEKAHFPLSLLAKLSEVRQPRSTPAEVFVVDHCEAGLLLALADLGFVERQLDQAHALFERVSKGAGLKVHDLQEQYAGRRLGDALIAQGQGTEATRHFTQLLRNRNRSDRPTLLLSLARLQVVQGQPANAFSTLQDLLDNHPSAEEVVEGQYLLAKVLLAQRQWNEAAAVLQSLQGAHPKQPWSREVDEVLLPLAKNQGVRKLTKGDRDPANPEVPKKKEAPKFIPFVPK